MHLRLRSTSAKFKMAHFNGFPRPGNNTFRPRFSSFQGRPHSDLVHPPPLMGGPPPRVQFPSQDFPTGGGLIQQTRQPSQPPRLLNQNSSRHFRGSEAAQRFPNSKEKLHNILQGALKGNSLSFSNKQVDFNFWQSTVNIPWPRPMSFGGEGSSKREAEKNAAALACVELEKLGVASVGAASVLKKEAMENKDEPRWIYIDDEKLSKVESFLLKYSVLRQQPYEPRNQQQILQCQPAQVAEKSLGPVNEIVLPGSSHESYSQSVSTNPEEFKQDPVIVKEHDFLNFPAQNTSESFIRKKTQYNADSFAPFNSFTTSSVVKDVFSGSPWKPLLSEQHKELSQQLLQEFSNRQNMLRSRNSCFNNETKTLPVASHRENITELIERNRVVVISGETGCGKTTQIPQFILDDAIQKGKGSACNIVVSQPRRIVAMSIAERVASERDEILGKSVGYQVRLEGRLPSQKGCVLFCTTGILLRRMQSNAFLKGVSHVIVDEVHERDINTDFLLILLKDLLEKNQDIKIIVMSATVNSERFSHYFRGCPSLVIPGFTHDVTEYFLSEVYEFLSRTPLSKPATVKSKRFKPDCSSSQPRFNEKCCCSS